MIRHASTDDIPRIINLIYKAKLESETYTGTINARKVERDLRVRLLNPYSLVIVNDDVTGCLVANANDTYFGAMKTGNEFFYADKHGLSLLRYYKRWALRWGPDTEVWMCLSFGGPKGEKARKVLEIEGFENIGPQMRLKHGNRSSSS